MQKKLIAVAIAGLAAAPAFAVDTSVTLYGLVDAGYSWRGDNYDSTKANRQGFDSGQLNGSRLGVRGVEEITPGLKGKFQIEAGVKADTGGSNQGGLAWGRQSWVGLDFGAAEVRFGRQYTPQFNMYAGYIDPFGLGGVAETNNVFTHIAARANNAAYLTTPFFGDVFAVEAMYTKAAGLNGAPADEQVGNKDNDRYYSIAPKLKLGKNVFLMANYSDRKVKGAPASIQSWDIGGVVDFGAAKISAAYAQPKDGTLPPDANGNKIKYNRFFVGATVPMGNFALLASYAYSKDKNDLNEKAQQGGLGGTYNLSPRTTLYGIYGQISTSDEVKGGYEVADATNSGFGYKKGAQFGVRHTF
ncbi:porin [Niveibacterium sp.]|uniref:porin n=1 Tax=Niveibacterium sp. TaxID=2017444 RepID=UPI0035B3DFF1